MTRDRRAGLVPMWTPDDERNLRRRVDRLTTRRDPGASAIPWLGSLRCPWCGRADYHEHEVRL